MRKQLKNLIGVIFLATAVLATQIPPQDVLAGSNTSSSDFMMSGNTLVQYTGTAKTVSVPVSVKKIAASAFSGCKTLESITVPSGVAEIGAAAFSSCSGLNSVTIEGNGLKALGDGAFAGCSKLNTVSFAANADFICDNSAIYSKDKTVFYELLGGTAQSDFTIPSSVTSMKTFACWGCTSLKTVSIPGTIQKITAYSFAGCTGLTSVTIPSSVKTIDTRAFSNCVNLTSASVPTSATVDKSAFEGCTKLNKSDIKTGEYEDTSQNATLINNSSVSGNNSASDTNSAQTAGSEATASSEAGTSGGFSIILHASGDSLATTKIVGQKAVLFIDNTKQTVINGNDSISSDKNKQTTVSGNSSVSKKVNHADMMQSLSNALSNSDEKGVTIPKYTEYNNTVVHQAYYQDTSLKTYNYPDKISKIGDFAFARSGLTETRIPDGVTSIGYAAFYHCDDLLTVSIPASVTDIEPYAFDHTAWLNDWMNNGSSDYLIVGDGILLAYRGSSSSVTIPDGVKYIGPYVFAGHTGLTSVIFPSGLKSIGESAFSGCSNLTDISLNDQLLKISDRAFSGCPLKNPEIPASVKQIGLGAFNLSGTSLSKSENTITFRGDVLPEVSSDKTSERLSQSADRIPSITGYSYAWISNAASSSMHDTVLDPAKPGFHGIVFTTDSSSADTVKPILKVSDQSGSTPELPSSIISEGTVYQVKYVSLPVSSTAASPAAKTSSSSLIYVSNQSSALGKSSSVSAVLDGNADPYILRISDSSDAKKILNDGYQSAYGTKLPSDCISFDMQLYDSTNTIPVTKMGTQRIKITFPLPASLQKNGTLHAITADEEGQLEELDYTLSSSGKETLITVETSHFSPFGLYEYASSSSKGSVQVKNGMVTFTDGKAVLDDTPDTGDLIDPKWFLVAGCFFLSIVFFLTPSKKQKKIKIDQF